MRPRLTATLVALAIVGVTVFAGAAPASAADPFDPALGGSSSAARQFKINVLGKILGKAAPTGWQREQLANANKYNQAWETLEAMYGTSANKGYSGPPDSYEDYVIRKKEIETTGKITVNGPGGAVTTKGSGKTFTAPASSPKPLMKGAAGAATAVSGIAFGLALGNGAADLGLGLFGQTKEGLICSEDVNDGVKVWGSLVNGVNCDALRMDPEYVPNTDATTGETFDLTYRQDGKSVTYAGQMNGSWPINPSFNQTGFCLSGEKMNPQPQLVIKQNGSYLYDSIAADDRSVCAKEGGYPLIAYAAVNAEPRVATVECIVPNGSDVSKGCTVPGAALPQIEQGDPNPERTIVCSIVGTDGKTYSAESEAYTEADGSIAAPVCPTLPEGVAPQSGTIAEKNQANGVTTDLAPIDVNQEFLDWWTDNPECRTGACAQELYKIENGQKIDCFENVEKCADWFEDPNKVQNYECWYNDKKVDQANCYVYAGMFKPGRAAAGNPYADPLTGKWSGGQNSPGVDDKAFGKPISDPDKMRTCLREAGTFNPIEWVMVPVQCALEWAAVPRPAVINTNVTAMTESWDKTTPGKFGAFVGGLKVDSQVTGCGGIPLDVPFLYEMGVPQINFGAACPGTWMGGIASTVRVILTLLSTWFGIVGISRGVGGTIGYRGLE